MNLTTRLDQVKGVGQRSYEQFQAARLQTIGDLIEFFPMRHEDFTNVSPITDLKPGKVTIKAHCESISTRPVRRGLHLTTAVLADATGKLNAVWFNQPYRTQQLASDDEFYFSGEFEFSRGRYQLSSPSAVSAKDIPTKLERLLPVYHSVKGLKSQLVVKTLEQLRPLMTMLPETLPSSVVASTGLLSRAEAISQIHFPASLEQAAKARERLAFEELFCLLLASGLNKRENSRLSGYKLAFDAERTKQFVASLPFRLTDAQRRVGWEILQDFERGTPMNRLLQGDVGSGKTVVAGLAAHTAVANGYQSAVMAPTEILAAQHAETLQRLLSPFGVSVALLVGSVKGKAREVLYRQLKAGEVDVIVGTHALFQSQVKFAKLAFVVIDEQHRFGVDQRQRLLEKSSTMPHLLAMTATPIPRSLALTVYGELDVSIIDQLPAGRKPITTKLISPVSAQAVYTQVDAAIAQGRQVYLICSLIDDNPENDLKSVDSEYKKLKNTIFAHRRIGLLHGKMKPSEKDSIMQDFKAGKYDILISTTVVEVGVDVPNASIIMIENADRFGLSQLHQLRGRVGRGQHSSYCYLMLSSTSRPSERLREIERSQDGFHLAEVDLKLRGPGEIYGRSQHGALNLKIATLADTKLISIAQRAAIKFIDSGEDLLQYKELASSVSYYQRLTTLN